MKVEIDTDSLDWWMKPFLAMMLVHDWENFNTDELKRYAELAGIDLEKPQEPEDKKPLG